jgi:hypothetical protein
VNLSSIVSDFLLQMPILQSSPKDYCESFDMDVLITDAEVYFLEEKAQQTPLRASGDRSALKGSSGGGGVLSSWISKWTWGTK